MTSFDKAHMVLRSNGEVTRRQVYACIFEHITLGGNVSMDLISSEVGLAKSTVKTHIDSLVASGWITHAPGGIRDYQLTDRARVDTLNGRAVIVEVMPG